MTPDNNTLHVRVCRVSRKYFSIYIAGNVENPKTFIEETAVDPKGTRNQGETFGKRMATAGFDSPIPPLFLWFVAGHHGCKWPRAGWVQQLVCPKSLNHTKMKLRNSTADD